MSKNTNSLFPIIIKDICFQWEYPPKPHRFSNITLQSSSPLSDPESDDISEDSRDTDSLADRNGNIEEMIGNYKDLKKDLYDLKDIARKGDSSEVSSEEKDAWNRVADSDNCDLNKNNINSDELVSEIKSVKQSISDLKQELADNQYGDPISSDSGSDVDLSDPDQSLLPLIILFPVELPVFTVLITLYKLSRNPFYRFYFWDRFKFWYR